MNATQRRIIAAAACVFPMARGALANHGPGTSGGGIATPSGETLKAGKFDISLTETYTQFQNVSRAEAETKAASAGEFDAIDWSSLTIVGISYGVLDDLQLSAAIGYYYGSNFVDYEREADGGVESSDADPSGLTDLSILTKYRLLKGQRGNLSVIGGVIFPTGKSNVRLSNGELLEPSSQPGTGAFAFQFGLAYSRFLTSRVTIDAGALYTLRNEHEDFEVGDRLDLGAAIAYRLTPSIGDFPNWSVFGEASAVWLGKDREDGEDNPNSGGWTVYLTPGARVRLNDHLALTIAAPIPVLQDLNGEQIRTEFKLAASLSYSF